MGLKRGISLRNSQFKRGQVTIFIILAIILVAGIAAYFILRSTSPSSQANVPSEFQPAYNQFVSCIEDSAKTGINVLESQGGYIYLPAFEPGSLYQPFSSQLNFLGNPIPYWYYISGNNIGKEQVPNETFMENQLAQFIDNKIRYCDFGSYSSEFEIQEGNPQARVTINPSTVDINLDMGLTFSKGNQSFFLKSHKVELNSELGNLYKSAKTVYDYEQSSFFLENYTLDALRNYAPVDGIDLSCSPKTWDANNVVDSLKQAIPENIMSLRTESNGTNYFDVNVPVNNLRFITSSNWPSSFEINPTEGSTMIAKPLGNQDGLGVLGFCYVPYHFVYSIKYPVLAIIRSGSEVFQFPIAVVIDNNLARKSPNSTVVASQNVPLCSQGRTNVTVDVYDTQSNPVNASLSYECFSNTCDIGQTQNGHFEGGFPQCANGYIVASADGFKNSRTLFSTISGGSVSIVMDKLYNETVNFKLGGSQYSGSAIITFTDSDGSSQTISYPNQKNIILAEGNYTIQAYVYQNSSINVGATSTQQCINVPSGSVLGAIGATQQQCYNVNIPSQIISTALAGGGSSSNYFSESLLANSNILSVDAPSFPAPSSLQQLQNNYVLLQDKKLTVSLS